MAADVRRGDSFETAFGSGDARAAVALMMPQVVSGSGDGTVLVGREAMERSCAALFAGPMRGAGSRRQAAGGSTSGASAS